jgi:hypothetical protein
MASYSHKTKAWAVRTQDQRCRLLASYPKDGTPSMLLNVDVNGEPSEKMINVTFVLPDKRTLDEVAPIDVSPSGPVDYRQPRLEPPRETTIRTPFGPWKTGEPGGWMR